MTMISANGKTVENQGSNTNWRENAQDPDYPSLEADQSQEVGEDRGTRGLLDGNSPFIILLNILGLTFCFAMAAFGIYSGLKAPAEE